MIVNIRIIRTKNFTAKMIHFGMLLWALIRFKKIKKSYNHTEISYNKYSSGAVAEGVKTRLWTTYLKNHSVTEWINYYIIITPKQWNRGLLYLDAMEGVPYEVENFWWHLVKIIIGKWKGSKTAKELFCYEHSIRFLNATGEFDLDPYMNPYQFKIWADKNIGPGKLHKEL